MVALLVDSRETGEWVASRMRGHTLFAPAIFPAEVANILRRASLAGEISADLAALAHADLLRLPVELFPYAPLSDRIWALRENLIAYDAWYVALAEALGAPLVTLDGRLARAPGPRCGFWLPES